MWTPDEKEPFLKQSADEDGLSEVRTCLEWISPFREEGLDNVAVSWTTPIGRCFRCGAASGLTIISKRDDRWTVEADAKGLCYGGTHDNRAAESRLVRIGPARYGVMFKDAHCLEDLNLLKYERESGEFGKYQSILGRRNNRFIDTFSINTRDCLVVPSFVFEEGPDPQYFDLRFRCDAKKSADGSVEDIEIVYGVFDEGRYLPRAVRKGGMRSDGFTDSVISPQ